MGRRLMHKEGIRSTILAAIAAVLAIIALVLAASGNTAQAASSVVNGNFETGDLTGWSVNTTASSGAASAVASYDYSYQVPCGPGEWGPCFTTATVRSKEGSYFALLTSGSQQGEAKISQPVEASNGDKVSGWAFFQTDNILSNPCTDANVDNAQVAIKSASGTTVAKPFQQNISTVPGPIQYTGGNSGWIYWEHTFTGLTGTGQFQIEAHVQNNAYTSSLSRMGLDDVKTSTGGPDATPPETYITSGPCGVSPSTSASFEFHSNEAGSTFKCQLSREGVVVQPWEDCTSPKSYSNLSRNEVWETSYRFEVKATDPAGNVDPTPASRGWYIDKGTDPPPPTDTTAPTAMAPKHSFTTLSTLGTTTVPVKLSWSATDNPGGSGIASYQLQQSVSSINGGAYTDVKLPSDTATTNARSLAPGTNTYRYRVAAKDNAGNLSAWATGPSFKVTAFQESSSAIVDTGTWTTSALSGAYGGSVQSASALGRNATFTVPATTKNVEWVSYRGNNRGKAQVWLDGVQQDAKPSVDGIQPFDLYSSTVQARKVVFSKAVSPTTSHKLEVRVLGKKNTSSTSTRVDIDAFVTTS